MAAGGGIILLTALGFLARFLSRARVKQPPGGTVPQSPVPRLPNPATASRRSTAYEIQRTESSGELERTSARPSAKALVSKAGPVTSVPVLDNLAEANALAARRLAVAEGHNQALDAKSHEAFHRKVAPPAQMQPLRGGHPARTLAQLQEATVWREILAPPVALRGDGNRER